MRAGKDAFMFRIANAAYNFGLTPNMMTSMGLTLGLSSGFLFALRAFPFAFLFGFLSVFCDVLDGTLARKFHLESRRGLVFDSASDRITECAVIVGALIAGIIQPLGLFAIFGSVALFTLRAISHRRGLTSNYVFFGRFERLVCILAGLLSPLTWLSTTCFIAAGAFGLISAAQIAVSLRRNKADKNKKLKPN